MELSNQTGRRISPRIHAQQHWLRLYSEKLVAYIARKLKTLRTNFTGALSARLRSIGARLAGPERQINPASSADRRHRRSTPVILLFDETQSVAGTCMTPEHNQDFRGSIRWVHAGTHGLPFGLEYASLASSGDLSRAASTGLSRLRAGATLTLARISKATSSELMTSFAEHYWSPAMPPQDRLQDWMRTTRSYSQRWPMHCQNFLSGLADGIKRRNRRPVAIELGGVRLRAAQLRSNSYVDQLQYPANAGHSGLISNTHMVVRSSGPMSESNIVAYVHEADRAACVDRNMHIRQHWTLAQGNSAAEASAGLLHAGIIRKFDKLAFARPLPSLVSYMAALAAWPANVLHRTELHASAIDVETPLGGCSGLVDKANLLRATDRQQRTPLIAAAECRPYPLVKQLAEREAKLQDHLARPDQSDKRGMTALAHAENDRTRERLYHSHNPTPKP